MDSLAVLLPVGLLALPSYLYFRRFFGEHPGVREWVAAWIVLYLTGIFDASVPATSGWFAAGELVSNLFVALLALGAFRFMERPAPKLMFPGLIAAGGITTAWQFADPPVGDAAGSLVRAVAIGWVAVLLLRHARAHEPGLGAKLIAPALLGVALVQVLDTDPWITSDFRSQIYAAWLVFAAASAAMQLMALVDRFQTRAGEMEDERELARRIPDAVARGGDLQGALVCLAQALHAPSLPQAAVFSLSSDGRRFDLVAWPHGCDEGLAPRVGLPADGEPCQRILASEGPVALEESLLPACRGLSTAPVVACALRAEGEVVGVLSVTPGHVGAVERIVRRLERLAPIAELALSRARSESERHLHANELGVTQRLLEATLAALPVGILFIDADGTIASANAAWARLLDLDAPGAWVGRPAVELFDFLRERAQPEERVLLAQQLQPWIDDPLLEGDPVEMHPDDGSRTLRITPKVTPGVSGGTAGRLFVIEDVTADRQMGERLQHAQRMESVGTLAGGLAHDFNNLLTAILGNAQLLLHDAAPEDEHREPLEDMARSAQHCAELTRGLLTFAQPGPVSRRVVEVAPLLAEVERLLRPSLPPDTALRMDVAPDTPPLLADPGELRRVLTSLLVNAREAVGTRGEIQCRVGPSADPEYVEVLVRDDGIGMAEATRRRAFDPFFTTKAKGRGTGLGLAVAYGIAEAHGARIEVESRLGKGSTFRLTWPAASPSDEELARPRGDDPPTVLVAEDEESVRRMVRKILQRAGYRVLEASDGERAVNEFARHRDDIALVLCDFGMPGRDGLSAVASMRVLHPGLPAVLMSGDPDREKEQARRADVDLLFKPFGPDQLLQRVGEALAGAAEARGS